MSTWQTLTLVSATGLLLYFFLGAVQLLLHYLLQFFLRQNLKHEQTGQNEMQENDQDMWSKI